MIPTTKKAVEATDVKTVWLIGMPGSGKSTLATRVNKVASFVASDTDNLFPDGSHLTATNHGPSTFYDIEEQVIVQYASTGPVGVIATGGSVVHRERACSAMVNTPHAIVVYLYTPLDIVKARLKNYTDRGVVFPPGIADLDELYRFRESIYRKHSDFIMDTSAQSVEECAQHLIRVMSKKNPHKRLSC